MKTTYALAYVLLTSWVGAAQNSPVTNAVERMLAAPGEPVAVSVPVPVVRVPVGDVVVPAEVEPTQMPAVVLTDTDMQLGWSATSVGLRAPTVTTVRTNRGMEFKGVVPRVTRSERKGFGGFMAGFANLFNPLAPTTKGIETRGESWYDGGVQTAPLPRGLRDERSHEPQTAIFSTDFGVGESPDKVPRSAAKVTVPAKP